MRTAEEIGDLAVDAKRLTIGGLGAGATLAEVEQRFGPPESWFDRRKGMLDYPELGLRLTIDREKKLSTFEVLPLDGAWSSLGDDPSSFGGRWLPWDTDEPPDEKKLIELRGEPTARETDEEELSLEWDSGEEIFVAADFGLDGKLRSFWVSV